MKISSQKLEKSEVKFIVELDDEELASYREKAAQSLSQRVQVAGFREGKAPAFTVEGQVGKESFFQEVLRFALPVAYAKAVEQEKMPVISRPRITIVSEYPLKFEAVAALMPTVIVKGYDKVKAPALPADVADTEVEDVVHEMKKMQAAYKPREGAIIKGDRAEITFEGFDEKGQPMPNTKSTNHPLFVGEGTLVPGFEDHLVGMKASEKKKFGVVFPKDFHHAPLREAKVTFEVTVNKAEEPVLPALDEIFVEKVYGQKIPVPEFKKRIKEDLQKQKAREVRERRENQLMEEWLKLVKVEIPQSLLEEEIDFLVDELKFDLEGKNIKFDQYLEFLKSKNRDLRKEKALEAEKRLKIRLLLNEIFKTEKIEITAAEIDVEIERYIMASPKDEQANVREIFGKNQQRRLQIENSLRLRRLFDRFLG